MCTITHFTSARLLDVSTDVDHESPPNLYNSGSERAQANMHVKKGNTLELLQDSNNCIKVELRMLRELDLMQTSQSSGHALLCVCRRRVDEEQRPFNVAL